MSIPLDIAKDVVVSFWSNELQHCQDAETVARYHSVATAKPEELLEHYKSIKKIMEIAIKELEGGKNGKK